MKCPVCGSTIKDNTTYCPCCGSYLKIEIKNNESEITEDLLNDKIEEKKEINKKKKIIDIRLIVLIIAILAIIGVILINNYLLSQNITLFSGTIYLNSISIILNFIYFI